MNESLRISVREIELRDIEHLEDYWLNSEPAFMIGMGVDLKKLPTREGLRKMLSEQIETPYELKDSYALIWEINGKEAGHSSVNKIIFGKEAYMHLHLWKGYYRKKGLGTELVKKSLPFYFENLKLEQLVSEPYALNPAPNRTLEKIGFEFDKRYVTVPGWLNFEQEVNRWRMTRDTFEKKWSPEPL